jgi:hypothetical protein
MEIYIELFIAVTGLVSVILKLIDSLTSNQRKKELVTDLELLSKASTLDLTIDEKEKIKQQTSKVLKDFIEYRNTKINWFDLFYALSLFVGFGWWTLEIYTLSSGFNPWIILTTLFSFIGLALVIDTNWMKKVQESKDNVLLKIIINKDIKFAVVVLGTTITLGLMLYFKLICYHNWMIIPAAIFLIGLKLLFDSIKFKKG